MKKVVLLALGLYGIAGIQAMQLPQIPSLLHDNSEEDSERFTPEGSYSPPPRTPSDCGNNGAFGTMPQAFTTPFLGGRQPMQMPQTPRKGYAEWSYDDDERIEAFMHETEGFSSAEWYHAFVTLKQEDARLADLIWNTVIVWEGIVTQRGRELFQYLDEQREAFLFTFHAALFEEQEQAFNQLSQNFPGIASSVALVLNVGNYIRSNHTIEQQEVRRIVKELLCRDVSGYSAFLKVFRVDELYAHAYQLSVEGCGTAFAERTKALPPSEFYDALFQLYNEDQAVYYALVHNAPPAIEAQVKNAVCVKRIVTQWPQLPWEDSTTLLNDLYKSNQGYYDLAVQKLQRQGVQVTLSKQE